MKFGNHALRKAEKVQVGDKVCFEMASAGYVVTGVEQTEIGMVRHQHDGGSNSYWPNELLYVQVEDPITAYYTDRANSGQAALAK